jgi:hypothetical protein
MSGQDGVSTRTLTALVYIVALAWAINLLAPQEDVAREAR